MENAKKIIMKVILIFFACMLLWTILMGFLDYDIIVYNFNPIIIVLGIIIYFIVLKLIYKKILPKIENNKVIPYVILRIIFYNLYNSFPGIKTKPILGYGTSI